LFFVFISCTIELTFIDIILILVCLSLSATRYKKSQQGRESMDVIKVKANSRTAAVAGAIAGVVREHHRADVQAIGAGAINQAVKALVLAKGYLAEDGINVVCIPEFVDVDIEGKIRTAIKLSVEPR